MKFNVFRIFSKILCKIYFDFIKLFCFNLSCSIKTKIILFLVFGSLMEFRRQLKTWSGDCAPRASRDRCGNFRRDRETKECE